MPVLATCLLCNVHFHKKFINERWSLCVLACVGSFFFYILMHAFQIYWTITIQTISNNMISVGASTAWFLVWQKCLFLTNTCGGPPDTQFGNHLITTTAHSKFTDRMPNNLFVYEAVCLETKSIWIAFFVHYSLHFHQGTCAVLCEDTTITKFM